MQYPSSKSEAEKKWDKFILPVYYLLTYKFYSNAMFSMKPTLSILFAVAAQAPIPLLNALPNTPN